MNATGPAVDVTYILPIRANVSVACGDLDDYIRSLAPHVELIIVDGSPSPVFATHALAWGSIATHVAPDDALRTPMGKVGGVLTGVARARHERLVIADDDVRYDLEGLRRVAGALDSADVVRPQNYFSPVPWHARWDTARMLLNRMSGGDWPGTLGVRRTMLQRTGGYDGSAMFENLELVRTVVAAGGKEVLLLDTLIPRRPSTARHFWSQRVRQAYDEFARPHRLIAQLTVLPLNVLACMILGGWPLSGEAVILMLLAELGRRRGGGAAVFPVSSVLFAPLWVCERAVCSWLALGSRVLLGGVSYRGTVLPHAATPLRVLQRRFARERAACVAQRSTTPRQSA